MARKDEKSFGEAAAASSLNRSRAPVASSPSAAVLDAPAAAMPRMNVRRVVVAASMRRGKLGPRGATQVTEW